MQFDETPVFPREGKNTRSLRLKVELLEAAITTNSVPPEYAKFTTVSQVAAWEDLKLGLSVWTSYSVTATNGRNAELASRLKSVLKKINAKNNNKKSGNESRQELARLKMENKVLCLQNENILAEMDDLRLKIRIVMSQLEAANRRLSTSGLKVVG